MFYARRLLAYGQSRGAFIASFGWDRYELILPFSVSYLIGTNLGQFDAELLGLQTVFLLACHFAGVAARAIIVIYENHFSHGLLLYLCNAAQL